MEASRKDMDSAQNKFVCLVNCLTNHKINRVVIR